MTHDFCVIGGGIVGLATALALLERQPGAKLVLIEKEEALALHQTGHNSGVIHSGIYYAPGSLKARLCREGAEATKAFCRQNGIPFEICGKLIVATNPLEMARMKVLEARAAENGIAIDVLDAAELREAEPSLVGLGALLVHSTGIVDYRRVCAGMADAIRRAGGEVRLGITVTGIRETAGEVVVSGGGETWHAGRLIVCAGLQSDRLARLAGLDIKHRIVPFRGEYYVLPPSRSEIVGRLVYPVPDPDLPFLGVHITRMIDGRVTLGPNAVLGGAREGYPKLSASPRDTLDFALFPGFWKMARQHWRSAVGEMYRSVSRAGYLEECRKYCPSLTVADLQPYPAGIRAQAVDDQGKLIHDFLFLDTARSLHVCNAPSPAATSALPIGALIADRVLTQAA